MLPFFQKPKERSSLQKGLLLQMGILFDWKYLVLPIKKYSHSSKQPIKYQSLGKAGMATAASAPVAPAAPAATPVEAEVVATTDAAAGSLFFNYICLVFFFLID